MHSSKIIKLCKIESVAFAKYCIEMGVDLLGVHVLSYALDENTQKLVDYIQEHGGHAVILTKEHDPDTIKKMIDYYRPSYIQLHAPLGAVALANLKNVLSVDIIPVITDETGVDDARQIIDGSSLVIYDSSYIGGTGTPHEQNLVSYLSKGQLGKVLLAGGITPTTIRDTANAHFGGYDVQSYVRVDKRHNYARASKIIEAIKGHPTGRIDVSLTDAINLPVVNYENIPNLHRFHLDYSVGNLYQEFKVDINYIESTIVRLDAPFTIHIFESNLSNYQNAIDHLMSLAKNNIDCIDIQYFPGLDIAALQTYDARKCVSIYYKDIPEYVKQRIGEDECLSIILPSDNHRKPDVIKEYYDFIAGIRNREVWFDRGVDVFTVNEVLRVAPKANFIAGKFIIRDWSNLQKINQIIQNANL